MGFFLRRPFNRLFSLYRQDQLLLNISVTNVKLEFQRPIKMSSLKSKKEQMVFMQEFQSKNVMGHAFQRYGFNIEVK